MTVQPDTKHAACEALLAAARVALKQRGSRERTIRIESRLEALEPLAWMANQNSGPSVYWRDRDGAFEMAGIGAVETFEADTCTTTQAIESMSRRLADAGAGVRYYGGARFDSGSAPAPHWAPFGNHWFVLPRVEVVRRGGDCLLACNLILENNGETNALSELASFLDTLHFGGAHSSESPSSRPATRVDHPDYVGWNAMVRAATGAIGAGAMHKVVLARESVLDFPHRIDPALILDRLAATTSHSYHFFFSPVAGLAFLGASPERLYLRDGHHIESEALAGTRARGGSRDTDQQLAIQLLEGEKERREHQYVAEALQVAFGQLCVKVHADAEPVLRPLRKVQHLYSRIEGELIQDGNDAILIETLHPTPAVGGAPTRAAIQWIRTAEPFDRGWYAGPVGWLGRDGAEFAVAIRSGLVDGTRLRLYSGAGIVEGSTPESEWDEIETKVSNFLGALTADEE